MIVAFLNMVFGKSDSCMEVFRCTNRVLRAFFFGLTLGVFLMLTGIFLVEAATGVIRPDGDGTVNGTQTTCGGGGNFDCVNDPITEPTAATTTDDYVTLGRNVSDYYQMGTLTGVDTVSQIDVKVYHQETKTNMQLEVSLWDVSESTQYGGNINLSNRTTAQWDTATFSGLTLSQAQLNGLRVRVQCLRTGTGGAGDCNNYATYADVTFTEVIDVIVSAADTQQDLRVGTTTAHVGGTFVITENTSNRDITSITITENGTVDGLNDLDNIRLQYDLDTTAPYDCASEGYNSTDTQFGATDTTGFSAANGTSVFTGTQQITTTQTMCVYVVVDVLDSATFGETIELEITDPSVDVAGSGTPNVTPSTAILLPGTTTLLDDRLDQIRYHWRQDNGDETNTGADSYTSGTENTAIAAATKGTNFRLRLQVDNTGNATSSATQYRVEYGVKGASCSAIAENDWIHVASTTDDWDMVNSTFIADGNTTNITTAGKGAITDPVSSTFVGTGALRETTDLSGSITLADDEFTELEYSLAAAGTIVDGTTYCFRLTDNGTPLDTYTVYPEVTFQADVAAAAEEAQPSTISIATGSNQLLGAFVFTPTAGLARDIDQITITASSTGDDITADFDNIELYYEIDNDGTPNCASESYAGTETLYGNQTDTDGFSVNGTSTFTGGAGTTPTVGPTQAVCLYVILDVTASADDGDLLDIYIADASTDVVLDTGTVSPASSVNLSGTTELTSPFVLQGNYHWRNNDGDEAGATSYTGGAENFPATELPTNSPIRLRFDVSNTGGEASGNYQYQLEWAQKVGSCDASSFMDVDVANDEFEIVASQLVDGNDTTDVLVADGGVTNQANTFDGTNTGQEESSSLTSNIDIAADNYIELEYSLQATASTTEGATYCFRLTNNGALLDDYLQYPEVVIKLATDFVVTRGVATIGAASTTETLIEGVDYNLRFNDPSRAFMRITNYAQTGAGPVAAAANNFSSDVTAYISNPENIATSTTLARAGTNGTTRISWEVIEYVGEVGGENEIIVRQHGVASHTAGGTTVTTPTISGIVDDNDVVPWIAAQNNNDGGRFFYHTGLSISAWNAGADTATFTRGDSRDVSNVTYAIIEFTGTNWIIQRAEHTYTNAGQLESESITSVNSLTRTFLHVQKFAGVGQDDHSDMGHEVFLNSIGTIQFRLDGQADTPASHTSVAWVIENTQDTGNVMRVTRSNGTITGGGTAPVVANPDIGKTLDDLTISSIFFNARVAGDGRTFQEPFMSAGLLNSSTTQYEIWQGDPPAGGEDTVYRAEVVEWPTASSKLFQNYFRIYVDNDDITPAEPWPAGGPFLAENAEMTAADGPIGVYQNARIRMSLNVTAAALAAGVDAFKLQYALRPDGSTCAASSWFDVGELGSTTAAWRGTTTTPVDGTTLPSTLLSVSDVAGTFENENNSALVPNNALVGDDIEYDWVVEDYSAIQREDYCFRMVYADGIELESYTNYPVLRTVGYGPEVTDWRWYDDETNVTPTVPLAATNTAPIDVAFDNTIKLRMVIAETSGATGFDTKFKLQFSETADFSGVVTDVVSSTTCAQTATTTAQLWCYADAAGVDNAVIDDNVLFSADACTAGSGPGCGTHNEGAASTTATYDHTALTNAEFEFTLRNDGARANAVYYFRLYDVVNEEVVPVSASYPSLVVEGAQLVFSLSGITSGTVSEGVTADVSTTPTAIPFGSVPPDTEYEAIYRLNVDTSSTEGYQMFMYATQPLLNTYGEQIPFVTTGTNASPVGWTTACPPGTMGCFGYHAGDDVLAGGSTRFAADDTYAALSTTTPEEIMHSSVPTNESIDIVYKLQIDDLQPAGVYQSEIVYLVVPTF